MDLAEGGDLYDKLGSKRRYTSELEVKKHFRQILSALLYCHQMGVAHRDLKPENILLDKDDNVIIAGTSRFMISLYSFHDNILWCHSGNV